MSEAPGSLSSSKSVLVVEDDPGVGTLVVTVLRRAGFDAFIVKDGRAAMVALSRRAYGAIVLDLLMPVMNGLDVLEELEKSSKQYLSRVIVLTAASPESFKQYEVKERVFRVLRKPFDLDELLSTVSKCLDQKLLRSGGRTQDEFIGFRAVSVAAHAKAGIVALIDPAGRNLHLVWSFGYPPGSVAPYNPLFVTRETPIGAAICERNPVWIRSRHEAAASFGSLMPLLVEHQTHALAAVPIVVNDVIAGSIGWSFAEEQRFDDEQKNQFLQIALAYGSVIAERNLVHEAV